MSEVGGNFDDVFAIDDCRWALVIGDVCGTGPDAAAVTAIARHTIRAAATHGADPPAALVWLNDALHAGNRGLFATVAYLTLEPNGDGTWQITTTSAGHPFPVIGRLPTAPLGWSGSPGMLVGAVPSITVTPVEGRLERGDTLVLYTDGVTDVSPPHGLDPDELEKLVARACERETDVEDIAVGLGREIEQVLPISERNDDVACRDRARHLSTASQSQSPASDGLCHVATRRRRRGPHPAIDLRGRAGTADRASSRPAGAGTRPSVVDAGVDHGPQLGDALLGIVLDAVEVRTQLLQRAAVGEEHLHHRLELERRRRRWFAEPRAEGRRPAGVIAYTVRGRLPVCSSLAVAKPAATRCCGSS